MIARNRLVSASLRILLAAAACLAAGCDMNTYGASQIPELSERERWEPWFVAAYRAEAIDDPVRRCLQYPSPPNLKWSPAIVEALCRDEHTPVPQVDTIKAFIDRKDWEGLDAHYDGYLKRHYSGEDPEYIVYRVFPRYGWRDEADMLRYTQRWLKAQPEDAYANLLHSQYLIWKAWDTRSEKFASEISPERMRRTIALAREASLLLKRAIKAEPRLLPAHKCLIEASALAGETDLIPHVLKAAAKQSPTNYYVRAEAAFYKSPMWGGSYAELNALAADAEPYVDRNPRLSLLDARSKTQLGRVRERGKHYGRSLKAARDALQYGPEYELLELATRVSDDIGFESETQVYLSQIVRFNWATKQALMRRGWLWEQNGFYPWALNDYRSALKITPNDAALAKRIRDIEAKAGQMRTAK